MTKIKAEIVADSLSPQGDRLTSLLITFPRIILAEINTHRMLSKNTSSSRAIPFNKMVESISDDPFIPIAWQKRHSGMQGSEYFTDTEMPNSLEKDWFKNRWLEARDNAINQATIFNNAGVTKQLCNRLLEPFMWTTMLITGSKEGWDNFFELRCPQYVEYAQFAGGRLVFKSKKEYIETLGKGSDYSELDWFEINEGHAEIHMMALAEAIYDAMRESTPKQLQAGRWHIPFRDKLPHTFYQGYMTGKMSIQSISHQNENMDEFYTKLSTALAARTSYTVVGDEKELDWKKLLGLHDRLISQDPPHSSPMEHCARAMSEEEYRTFIKGKSNANWDTDLVTDNTYEISAQFDNNVLGWCRNFKGFIPYRAIIENSN